ncbi:MAG: hypothetical protein ACRCST_11605 [Turicibacter sp.]
MVDDLNRQNEITRDFLHFSTAIERRSVGKINTQEEYTTFLNKNKRKHLVIQPKLDGCNILCYVVDGFIVKATTRNGHDVSEKINNIKVYGLNIKHGFLLGELVNSNGRAIASGFLIKKSPTEKDYENNQLIIFQSYNIKNKTWSINEDISSPFNQEEIIDVTQIKIPEKYNDIPCDGVVIKQYENALFGVAYKGLCLWYETVITGVFVTVSKAGKETPVCYVKPFQTANGKTIKSLSLYSMDVFKQMNVTIGDVVIVKTESNGDFPVLCGKKILQENNEIL